MQHVGEEKFEKGLKIICTIPSFKFFVTGDLHFMLMFLGCQIHLVTGAHGV
jgi:hypothetical protein